MTFGEILFWFLVIVLLIVLYKVNTTIFWIVLIIAIIIFIYRLFTGPVTIQTFDQMDSSGQITIIANCDLMDAYPSAPAYPTNHGLIPTRYTNSSVLNSW